jgi:hypothetical protein
MAGLSLADYQKLRDQEKGKTAGKQQAADQEPLQVKDDVFGERKEQMFL